MNKYEVGKRYDLYLIFNSMIKDFVYVYTFVDENYQIYKWITNEKYYLDKYKDKWLNLNGVIQEVINPISNKKEYYLIDCRIKSIINALEN